jgi:gliding motility-associated protein GldC
MSIPGKSPRNSTIHLTIQLDESNIPDRIQWEASDAGAGINEAKALLLGLWDKQQANGVSIDLWTKEMTIPEMNIFFYQTLLSLSDTMARSTQDASLSEMIRGFADEFLQRVNQKS